MNTLAHLLHRLTRFAGVGVVATVMAAAVPGPVTPAAAAEATAEVLDIRVGRHPDTTRLVIDLSTPIGHAVQYADDHRIVIMFEGDAAFPAIPAGRNVGLISAVFVEGRAIVMELREPARVTRAFTLPGSGPDNVPHRLVFDLGAVPRAEWGRLVAQDRLSAAADQAAYPVTATAEATIATDATEAPPRATPRQLDMARAGESGLFDGLSIDGYVELQGRAFPDRSNEPGPGRLSGSVALEPTITYAWNNGRSLVAFTPFGRLDSEDSKRTRADIRELKVVHALDRFEIRLGIDKVFWGVVESHHLVDIINQDDQLEDIDRSYKLGQPMAVLSYDSGFGLFSAYATTYFRERQFPGPDGRPQGPLRIARELTQFEASSDKWHVDWAVRWSHHMGPFDVAVSHFRGVNRHPQLLTGLDGAGDPVLIPRYNLTDQTGVELQGTFGPLLLKGEGIRRTQPGRTQYAFIGGFEFTLFNVLGQSDLGVLAEYLYDNRDRPADNPFDNDVFVGLRWTANDIAGTTLLAGGIFDLDSKAKFFKVEASRRFGSHWRMALDARIFTTIPDDHPFYYFRDDSFVMLRLQRFF